MRIYAKMIEKSEKALVIYQRIKERHAFGVSSFKENEWTCNGLADFWPTMDLDEI